jgi:hypothetical protein
MLTSHNTRGGIIPCSAFGVEEWTSLAVFKIVTEEEVKHDHL